MSNERWIGIDFSGNQAKWSSGCSTSNVWIADVRGRQGALQLHDVRRVQQLGGVGLPFDRLVSLLATGGYIAAAIDAPFSIPEPFVVHAGGHAALLSLVASSVPADRDFLTGASLVQLVTGPQVPLVSKKPLRTTERWWARVGVNTRSTLWAGARGGAPMTAACLTLLHRAARPIWPWAFALTGLVLEAFPAAQLRTWRLPHQKYDGPSSGAVATRQAIVAALRSRIHLGAWTATLLGSADALDAVICAFAAMTVARVPTSSVTCTEGFIVVHP